MLQWRDFENFKVVYQAVMEFIEFYNNRSFYGSIGFKGPMMFIYAIKAGQIMPQLVAA